MPDQAPDDRRQSIDQILAELTEPGGFDAAEQRIAEIAPQLKSTLDSALSAGGWFDDAHHSVVLKTATTPDENARIEAVGQFVLEQTRLGMLVGVAVGWEIAERLAASDQAEDVPTGAADDAEVNQD